MNRSATKSCAESSTIASSGPAPVSGDAVGFMDEREGEKGALPQRVQHPCPGCGADAVWDFYRANRLPQSVGMLYDDIEKARRAPTGDVILSYCARCGLAFNRLYSQARVSFEPGYEVSLEHSPLFREFMSSVAARLIERYDLRGKQIIEIGCGKGWFLRLICEAGGNFGIGFDTSVPETGDHAVGNGRVELRREYFGLPHAALPCDFIACLSVFEDIEQPARFLTMLRQLIGARRSIRLYFEVFNAFRAFRELETWSIHYEQCNYYSLAAFQSLFVRHGFDVLEAGACFGNGQYLYVEAAPADWNPESPPAALPEREVLPAEIAEFSRVHQSSVERWTERLSRFRAEQRRIVAWGSGGKGISFLSSLPTEGLIDSVVDVNPDRQNRYLPLTGCRIVAPEFLIDYRPDLILLTNPLYEKEIRQQVLRMGLACEFLRI